MFFIIHLSQRAIVLYVFDRISQSTITMSQFRHKQGRNLMFVMVNIKKKTEFPFQTQGLLFKNHLKILMSNKMRSLILTGCVLLLAKSILNIQSLKGVFICEKVRAVCRLY